MEEGEWKKMKRGKGRGWRVERWTKIKRGGIKKGEGGGEGGMGRGTDRICKILKLK